MGTGLRGRWFPARALLAAAGLLVGLMVVALPSAGAAAAPGAGRFPIPAASGDQVGARVAISGTTAVIGAPGVDGGRGAVYVFARSGKTWQHQATLPDLRQRANDSFGATVAVSTTSSGTFVLVGAPGQGSPEQAYVFARSGKTWYRQATLAGPSGSPYDSNDDFGYAVALSATTAVVSTNQDDPNLGGPIYVFGRSGKTWHRQAILDDPDGGSEMNFGGSVAVSGASLVVGASNRGCAFVFARSGQKWAVQATLLETGEAAACPTEPTDSFGWSVAISGSTVLIGAGDEPAGGAFVFTRSGTTWFRQAELADPHSAGGDNFGYSAALSGGTALVGAPFLGTSHCGTAYEFTGSGATWRERATLVNPGCSGNDEFGLSVAESGSTALAGAPGLNQGAGAAYWQTLP
jgi:FG-GAP repeat